MRNRLYFGHPVNTYNIELETQLLEAIVREFPDWEIENPNQKKHQEGYKKWMEETGNGMKYFTEEVLPSCDGGVFLAFRDGKWGAGVAKEGIYFLERDLAVCEVTLDFEFNSLDEFSADRTLSVDETRKRIRDKEGNLLQY